VTQRRRRWFVSFLVAYVLARIIGHGSVVGARADIAGLLVIYAGYGCAVLVIRWFFHGPTTTLTFASPHGLTVGQRLTSGGVRYRVEAVTSAYTVSMVTYGRTRCAVPDDPIDPMLAEAVACHQTFLNLQRGGFTENQALKLVAFIMRSNVDATAAKTDEA
jgi:hypothetical protein